MVATNQAVRLPFKYGINIVSKPWILVAVIRFEITFSSIILIMWSVAVGRIVQNNVALPSSVKRFKKSLD